MILGAHSDFTTDFATDFTADLLPLILWNNSLLASWRSHSGSRKTREVGFASLFIVCVCVCVCLLVCMCGCAAQELVRERAEACPSEGGELACQLPHGLVCMYNI